MRIMVETSKKIVRIKAHARLHFGFFDLHGGLGRKFGSLGVALENPFLELEMKLADRLSVTGNFDAKSHEHITNFILNLLNELNIQMFCELKIVHNIPNHAGFGSGTQMMLGIVALVNHLYQLNLSETKISILSGRGARSGVGLGTFFQGGAVVDAGRGFETQVPPVIARVDFPDSWRILLIFDDSFQGVHGEHEVSAFKNLCEFPASLAEKLCRSVLMQALPALHEHDLFNFGAAVRALQLSTGEHFAQAQGGLYASRKVANVLNYLENRGVVCFGQSSWGPTGFAVLESEAVSQTMLFELRDKFSSEAGLKFELTKAANRGATVTTN